MATKTVANLSGVIDRFGTVKLTIPGQTDSSGNPKSIEITPQIVQMMPNFTLENPIYEVLNPLVQKVNDKGAYRVLGIPKQDTVSKSTLQSHLGSSGTARLSADGELQIEVEGIGKQQFYSDTKKWPITAEAGYEAGKGIFALTALNSATIGWSYRKAQFTEMLSMFKKAVDNTNTNGYYGYKIDSTKLAKNNSGSAYSGYNKSGQKKYTPNTQSGFMKRHIEVNANGSADDIYMAWASMMDYIDRLGQVNTVEEDHKFFNGIKEKVIFIRPVLMSKLILKTTDIKASEVGATQVQNGTMYKIFGHTFIASNNLGTYKSKPILWAVAPKGTQSPFAITTQTGLEKVMVEPHPTSPQTHRRFLFDAEFATDIIEMYEAGVFIATHNATTEPYPSGLLNS